LVYIKLVIVVFKTDSVPLFIRQNLSLHNNTYGICLSMYSPIPDIKFY